MPLTPVGDLSMMDAYLPSVGHPTLSTCSHAISKLVRLRAVCQWLTARHQAIGHPQRDNQRVSEGAVAPKRAADKAGDASVAGLSAFVAKVLNQLSLSAWLPAAIFISSLTVLAQFRRHGNLSFSEAFTEISAQCRPALLL